jgi:hypothetical protein
LGTLLLKLSDIAHHGIITLNGDKFVVRVADGEAHAVQVAVCPGTPLAPPGHKLLKVFGSIEAVDTAVLLAALECGDFKPSSVKRECGQFYISAACAPPSNRVLLSHGGRDMWVRLEEIKPHASQQDPPPKEVFDPSQGRGDVPRAAKGPAVFSVADAQEDADMDGGTRDDEDDPAIGELRSNLETLTKAVEVLVGRVSVIEGAMRRSRSAQAPEGERARDRSRSGGRGGDAEGAIPPPSTGLVGSGPLEAQRDNIIGPKAVWQLEARWDMTAVSATTTSPTMPLGGGVKTKAKQKSISNLSARIDRLCAKVVHQNAQAMDIGTTVGWSLGTLVDDEPELTTQQPLQQMPQETQQHFQEMPQETQQHPQQLQPQMGRSSLQKAELQRLARPLAADAKVPVAAGENMGNSCWLAVAARMLHSPLSLQRWVDTLAEARLAGKYRGQQACPLDWILHKAPEVNVCPLEHSAGPAGWAALSSAWHPQETYFVSFNRGRGAGGWLKSKKAVPLPRDLGQHRLQWVALHVGRHCTSGHWIAACAEPGGRWHMHDDAVSTPMPEQRRQVMDQEWAIAKYVPVQGHVRDAPQPVVDVELPMSLPPTPVPQPFVMEVLDDAAEGGTGAAGAPPKARPGDDTAHDAEASTAEPATAEASAGDVVVGDEVAQLARLCRQRGIVQKMARLAANETVWMQLRSALMSAALAAPIGEKPRKDPKQSKAEFSAHYYRCRRCFKEVSSKAMVRVMRSAADDRSSGGTPCAHKWTPPLSIRLKQMLDRLDIAYDGDAEEVSGAQGKKARHTCTKCRRNYARASIAALLDKESLARERGEVPCDHVWEPPLSRRHLGLLERRRPTTPGRASTGVQGGRPSRSPSGALRGLTIVAANIGGSKGFYDVMRHEADIVLLTETKAAHFSDDRFQILHGHRHNNPYDAGVAIAFRSDLVVRERHDMATDILRQAWHDRRLLMATLFCASGAPLLDLTVVYGHVRDHEYTNAVLGATLLQRPGIPAIVGGDWNVEIAECSSAWAAFGHGWAEFDDAPTSKISGRRIDHLACSPLAVQRIQMEAATVDMSLWPHRVPRLVLKEFVKVPEVYVARGAAPWPPAALQPMSCEELWWRSVPLETLTLEAWMHKVGELGRTRMRTLGVPAGKTWLRWGAPLTFSKGGERLGGNLSDTDREASWRARALSGLQELRSLASRARITVEDERALPGLRRHVSKNLAKLNLHGFDLRDPVQIHVLMQDLASEVEKLRRQTMQRQALQRAACFREPSRVRRWAVQDSVANHGRVDLPAAALAWSTIAAPQVWSQSRWLAFVAQWMQDYPAADPIEYQELTGSVLAATLKHMKRSSPGPDGVTWEILRSLPAPALDDLAALMRHWELHGWPSAASTAWVALLPKDGAVPGEPLSWRPITVTSTLMRLWSRVREAELAKVITKLPESESLFGGLAGRSTLGGFWRAQQAVCSGGGASRAVTFDMSKCFDCIPRELLAKVLKQCGLDPRRHLGIYGSLHRIFKDRGRVHPQPIEVQEGLIQGDPQSPKLLGILLPSLAKVIKQKVPTATVTIYVDDITVVAPGLTALQAATNVVCEFANAVGFTLNAGKCHFASCVQSEVLTVFSKDLVAEGGFKMLGYWLQVAPGVPWDGGDGVQTAYAKTLKCFKRIAAVARITTVTVRGRVVQWTALQLLHRTLAIPVRSCDGWVRSVDRAAMHAIAGKHDHLRASELFWTIVWPGHLAKFSQMHCHCAVAALRQLGPEARATSHAMQDDFLYGSVKVHLDELGGEWVDPDHLELRDGLGEPCRVDDRSRVGHALRALHRRRDLRALQHRRSREFGDVGGGLARVAMWKAAAAAVEDQRQWSALRAMWCGLSRFPARIARHDRLGGVAAGCVLCNSGAPADEKHVLIECCGFDAARAAGRAALGAAFDTWRDASVLHVGLCIGVATEAAWQDLCGRDSRASEHYVSWLRMLVAVWTSAAAVFHRSDGVAAFGRHRAGAAVAEGQAEANSPVRRGRPVVVTETASECKRPRGDSVSLQWRRVVGEGCGEIAASVALHASAM